MKKLCFITGVAVLSVFIASSAFGKGKILHVDSYHEGYAWSDGIVRGVQSVLAGYDVELKIVRMDTKRNTSKTFKRQAAVKVKTEIERFRPDVVIAADDNASKYLIKPFYKNSKLPVVFCAVNWDASVYGYPYKNATGMVEVAPIEKLLGILKGIGKGDKIAYLAADVATTRKEALNYKKIFNIRVTEIYVKTFAQWQKKYADIQNDFDILIVANKAGINDWDDSAAENTVLEKTRIPSGTIFDFLPQFALVGLVKSAEEQGVWSAKTALKIMDGTDPASIPMTKNKIGRLTINRKIEKVLGIRLPENLVSEAETIIE